MLNGSRPLFHSTLNIQHSTFGSSTESVGAFLPFGMITPVISIRSVVSLSAAFWFSYSTSGRPDVKTAVETAENAHPPPPRAFSAVPTATAATGKRLSPSEKHPQILVRR